MNSTNKSINILDNNLEQQNLQTFVETFLSISPLFLRSCPMRSTPGPSSLHSRATIQGSRLELIRCRVKTPELAWRDRFVAARSVEPDEEGHHKQGYFFFQQIEWLHAHFRSRAAVVNNCAIVDNKLANPKQLWSAILARLHQSHPEQEAMVSASEYIWWPSINRQIIKTCEDCSECFFFGKNLKSTLMSKCSRPTPELLVPNQELQLDFADPLVDEKNKKVLLLVAIDRFSKLTSLFLTKTSSA